MISLILPNTGGQFIINSTKSLAENGGGGKN